MVVDITLEEMEPNAEEQGIDFFQVDLNSMVLPLGEDFGIPSDDEEEEYLHKKLEEETPMPEAGYGNVVVVDHLPCVRPEKFKKLEDVIRKVFSQIGEIKEEGFWMPVDPDTEITRGYCVIEYSTSQEAEMTKSEKHGYKLDKNHILAVNLMDDFDRLVYKSDDWSSPEAKPYTPAETLQQWITDEKGRNQFLIPGGSDTEVMWNDPRQLNPEFVQHVCLTSHTAISVARHTAGAIVCIDSQGTRSFDRSPVSLPFQKWEKLGDMTWVFKSGSVLMLTQLFIFLRVHEAHHGVSWFAAKANEFIRDYQFSLVELVFIGFDPDESLCKILRWFDGDLQDDCMTGCVAGSGRGSWAKVSFYADMPLEVARRKVIMATNHAIRVRNDCGLTRFVINITHSNNCPTVNIEELDDEAERYQPPEHGRA